MSAKPLTRVLAAGRPQAIASTSDSPKASFQQGSYGVSGVDADATMLIQRSEHDRDAHYSLTAVTENL